MNIIEIAPLSNGAHRNQGGTFRNIPNGWAVIPDGMATDNFPFGEVVAEEIDGIMTVTSWVAGEIPKPEPLPEPPPSDTEVINALLGVNE